MERIYPRRFDQCKTCWVVKQIATVPDELLERFAVIQNFPNAKFLINCRNPKGPVDELFVNTQAWLIHQNGSHNLVPPRLEVCPGKREILKRKTQKLA